MYGSPNRQGPSNPSYTMGTKKNRTIDTDKPGPGNYDPKDFLSKNKSPNTLIGKSSRSDLTNKDKLPGPG
jgi:hypothetical protein